MKGKITRLLRSCDSCQRNKTYTSFTIARSSPIVPSKPLELISIDFCGPLPTSRGGVKYILAVLDAFSKFVSEGISPVFSAIRHPQSNLVERVNKEIGRFFRTLVSDQHTAWANWLPFVQSCLNESHPDTTEALRTFRLDVKES
ncbi:hypothetical protein TSAR_012728 [Trichomalopsis sarcophagae]|uniref:Integrase catalytic domain-containing protein n=1 Tax=Trichomalopsis sarcophagae TaxID=543379 RepID=A0A232EJX7_9HYME|nr:hypothetical protein TSAR_012728 [Trichomalopsis sarcophagae]